MNPHSSERRHADSLMNRARLEARSHTASSRASMNTGMRTSARLRSIVWKMPCLAMWQMRATPTLVRWLLRDFDDGFVQLAAAALWID